MALVDILGGNQSNMVNVVRLRKDRLITARRPASALAPEGTVVTADAGGGALSCGPPSGRR